MKRIFEKKYQVPADDVNLMNHVDNQVYLRWMIDIAFDHSAANGWGIKDFMRINQGFVVKSHFIEYLAPAFEGESLVFFTWISALGKKRATRKYQFYKAEDMSPLMKGETQWVFVDAQTGHPIEMPAEVANGFPVVLPEELEAAIN